MKRLDKHENSTLKSYFYEKTGMYIDKDQIKKLPEIDTLIDIGVGDMGTPDLYERFPDQKLILIDPLLESKNYVLKNLSHRDHDFFLTCLGKEKGEIKMNIEEKKTRSTILKVTDLNNQGGLFEERFVEINTLDNILKDLNNLGKLGIKIDTEGYELEVILGAKETLKTTKFVMAEVRHNHESFQGCYKLHHFMEAMRENKFQLSMIVTAKPLIADLVFQPITDLQF